MSDGIVVGVGKFIAGLVVISVERGLPSSPADSARRNLGGLGAKDLVRSFAGLAAEFDLGLGRPPRAPERVDRAA